MTQSAKIGFVGNACVSGILAVRTGLHIGAGKESVEIGGIDNPVVRDPITRRPYIPGSSIKGKLRFLFEWAFQPVLDSIDPRGNVWGADNKRVYSEEDPILRIFGTTARGWKGGPTRLMVRDAHLRGEWAESVARRGLDWVEEKTEVAIDRLAGKAMDGRLRTTERVPAGAEFELEMVFRLYDTGDGGARDKACLNWLIAGLGLLEQDALGGSGSRGYGRVEFRDLKVRLPSGEEREIGTRHRVNRFDPNAAPSILAF